MDILKNHPRQTVRTGTSRSRALPYPLITCERVSTPRGRDQDRFQLAIPHDGQVPALSPRHPVRSGSQRIVLTYRQYSVGRHHFAHVHHSTSCQT